MVKRDKHVFGQRSLAGSNEQQNVKLINAFGVGVEGGENFNAINYRFMLTINKDCAVDADSWQQTLFELF